MIPTVVHTFIQRRYVLRNVTYHYTPVEGTPFSIAVVVASSDATVVNVSRVQDELVGVVNDEIMGR